MHNYHNLDFTLRQAQYALAVADLGSFGGAAEACGVSQPSLSAQVAKLEQVLDAQIFERHARGVLVTQAGASLLPRMRAMLGEAEAVATTARTVAAPYSVTLRIGIIPTVAPYLLPAVVDRLRRQEPRPTVHWIELQTSVCEDRLANGQLDAILIADPPTQPSTDAQELGWEPFCVLVPGDHPEVRSFTLETLASEPLLLLDEGHCLRDHTMALCMLPGADESPYRATSLPTLVQMVAAGLGTSVLPVSAVPVETHRAHVRTVPFAQQGMGRTLRMAWRARTPHVAVLEELADLIGAALAEAVGPTGDELSP